MNKAFLGAGALAIPTAPLLLAQDHHDHRHGDHPAKHAQHTGLAGADQLPGATRRQLIEVALAVERLRDFSVARREGWKKFGGEEPLLGEHWYPPEKLGWPEYVGSKAQLEFSRSSKLIYATIDGRRVLTGVAFVARLADDEAMADGFACSSDRFQVHDFVRAINAATKERPVMRWIADWWIDANYHAKGDDRRRLVMVHAWVTLANPARRLRRP